MRYAITIGVEFYKQFIRHVVSITNSTAPSKHLWQAKRKGKGRTSSRKYLLGTEEADGGSNWTLTSGNGGK